MKTYHQHRDSIVLTFILILPFRITKMPLFVASAAFQPLSRKGLHQWSTSTLFTHSGILQGSKSITSTYCINDDSEKDSDIFSSSSSKRTYPESKQNMKMTIQKKKYKNAKGRGKGKYNTKSTGEMRQILLKQLQMLKHKSELSTSIQNEKYDSKNSHVDDDDGDFQKDIMTLEPNILNNIWACKNVTQVHAIIIEVTEVADAMIQHEQTNILLRQRNIEENQKDSTNHKTYGNEEYYNKYSIIGPNIASAALRRIVDLRPKQEHAVSKLEMIELDITQKLIPILLNIVGEEVVDTTSKSNTLYIKWKKLVDEIAFANSNNDVEGKSIDNVVLSTITPYSCANTLHVLGSLARMKRNKDTVTSSPSYQNELEINTKQYKNSNNSKIISNLQPFAEKICSFLIQPNKSNSSSSDINNINNNNNKRIRNNMELLAPQRLLEIINALATLQMNDQTFLIQFIAKRLSKGDAIGQLTGREISMSFKSFSILKQINVEYIKSFTRRLRKATIRNEMSSTDLCRAIWSIGQLTELIELYAQDEIMFGPKLQHEDENNGDNDFTNNITLDKSNHMDTKEITEGWHLDHEEMAMILNECETCCYTLIRELMRPFERERSDTIGDTIKQNTKIRSLNPSQIADILSTCVIFEFNNDEEILSDLLNHLFHSIEVMNTPFDAVDIARILWSIQRLKIKDHSDVVTALSNQYINSIKSKNVLAYAPKRLNTVLRSIVMILPDNGRNQLSLFNAISPLLSDDKYLEKCNEFEVSNFAFVMAMADYYDKDVIQALSRRMKNEDIASTCTPSSASRFLWSLSRLVNNKKDYEMNELLFEMFQSLLGVLLSLQLTPVDASSAMWAIAKSSYSLDMGIFDHLAELLAKDYMLEKATVQQICHALWACGKMIHFEDFLKEMEEYGEFVPPPYAICGKKYATFLVSVRDQMTEKDVAQALWAVGRLKITDMTIVNALAAKAANIALKKQFNSQEIANIIWGLSKTGFNDEIIITILAKQMRENNILQQTTPQEAANVMYGLGKMKLRDEKTFSCMNAVVMSHLEDATTQTIANTLWAHDCVNLAPPQQLFDSWAKEKLDIVGLYLDNKKVEVMQKDD